VICPLVIISSFVRVIDPTTTKHPPHNVNTLTTHVISMSTAQNQPPAPMDVEETVLADRPRLSVDGQRLAHKFGKGDIVSDTNRLTWERTTHLDEFATELVDLHRCSRTLEQIGSWEHLPVNCDISCNNSRTQHLGQGVFVEDNQLGIDPDSERSPKTITTVESRKFAMMCLESALDNLVLERLGGSWRTPYRSFCGEGRL
jgi:hypothetical protein